MDEDDLGGPALSRREFLGLAVASPLLKKTVSEMKFGLATQPPKSQRVLPPKSGPGFYTLVPGCEGEPIHLSASVVLQPNSGGAPNAIALMSPSKGPIEIDEIKFQLQSAVPSGGITSLGTNLGGTVACDLGIGSEVSRVTNGPIPCWLFGRAENNEAERRNDNSTIYSEFRWRLAKPLFVPGGRILLPSFAHLGFVNTTITARISYSGRQFVTGTPTPKVVHVPYVSAYRSIAFPLDATVRTDTSDEASLQNPFTSPLYVQHFTGRAPVYGIATNPQIDEINGTEDVDGLLTVTRMLNSEGEPVVRDAVSFRMVFGRDVRAWCVPHTLAPSAFYQIFMSCTGSTTNQQLSTSAQVQAQVGMIGWRDEDGASI